MHILIRITPRSLAESMWMPWRRVSSFTSTPASRVNIPEPTRPAMRCICTDALEEYLVQDDVVCCLVSPSLSSKPGECMKEPLCLVCCLRHVVINLETPLEDDSQVPNTLPESQIASRSWYSRWSTVVQLSLQQHSHRLPFGDSQLVAGCPALHNCHGRSSSFLIETQPLRSETRITATNL